MEESPGILKKFVSCWLFFVWLVVRFSNTISSSFWLFLCHVHFYFFNVLHFPVNEFFHDTYMILFCRAVTLLIAEKDVLWMWHLNIFFLNFCALLLCTVVRLLSSSECSFKELLILSFCLLGSYALISLWILYMVCPCTLRFTLENPSLFLFIFKHEDTFVWLMSQLSCWRIWKWTLAAKQSLVQVGL